MRKSPVAVLRILGLGLLIVASCSATGSGATTAPAGSTALLLPRKAGELDLPQSAWKRIEARIESGSTAVPGDAALCEKLEQPIQELARWYAAGRPHTREELVLELERPDPRLMDSGTPVERVHRLLD